MQIKLIATTNQSIEEGHLLWKNLPPCLYKVNWDVVIDSTDTRLGIGVIVRDHMGYTIVVRSHIAYFVFEPVIA
jgi:hypothetical protein